MKICSSCDAKANSDVRKCPVCGAGSFFYVCDNCGTRFETTHCPQCGVARECREKVCPNCGRHTFDPRCPDCGRSMRDVAPIRAEFAPEADTVHAGEGVYATDEVAKAQAKQKKKESGCGIAAFAFSLIGYWCASDIGLASLTFLVPALILFALGFVLARVNNRRTWSLIAAGVLLALSAVMLALFPGGWGG
jgi:rRNA maturation protein Nop10